MNIQHLYEASLKHNNPKIASLHYKVNKGIANLLYPVFGSCEYGIDENANVIVSLTSYPARIESVHLTVKTLLNQTVKPQKVVLWLAREQFPNLERDLPKTLLTLREKGLTISFCDDLKPHKKYYYTMKENPECSVITVDDDILYPENLVELLTQTSAKFPDTVVCTWGHEITLEDGDVFTTNKWEYAKDGTKPSIYLIPTGIGGVLYPPHCLSDEVFNSDAIRRLCINTDDLWLKAMAVLNGKKAVRIDRTAKVYFSILKTQNTGLYYENAVNDKNAIAWKNIMEAYPECRKVLREGLE